MKITREIIQSMIEDSFSCAWRKRAKLGTNSKRSSYFVTQLSSRLTELSGGCPLVQTTDSNGNKRPGEWLLDIAVVNHTPAATSYKSRSSIIVSEIIWAVESEFSTSIHEFCKDFAKLLHVRAERYLYVAGVSQITRGSRENYIDAQIDLARHLVNHQKISRPFFVAFVPTPGKSGVNSSLWDRFDLATLTSWIRAEILNEDDRAKNISLPNKANSADAKSSAAD